MQGQSNYKFRRLECEIDKQKAELRKSHKIVTFAWKHLSPDTQLLAVSKLTVQVHGPHSDIQPLYV